VAATIAAAEAEEAALVEALHLERQGAMAAALVADPARAEAVCRVEAHLGRELERAFAALARVRGLRPRDPEPLGLVWERHLEALGGLGSVPEVAARAAG
jgi:hypothetical protein